MEHTHCRQPDRDVPGIVCGYPLPCPWHTLEVHGITEAVSLVLRAGAVAKVGELRRRKQAAGPARSQRDDSRR